MKLTVFSEFMFKNVEEKDYINAKDGYTLEAKEKLLKAFEK